MKPILIKNALLVNEGKSFYADLLIEDQRIQKISEQGISDRNYEIMDAQGRWLLPGVIDDQVHFREPGLTHKANIYTESRAAVAGGTTSFMEMPNTIPNAVTQDLLQQKYLIAQNSSSANYSFFMGTTNDNLDEILRTDPKKVCGLKIFMGSSTGNMLVDRLEVLENIFAQCPLLIATHCEDEETIKKNQVIYAEQYGDRLSAMQHPEIRSREACLISSTFAKNLALKYGTRLHILHITTADEIALFEASSEISKKQITSEVCVHHLSFDAEDYAKLGNKIKCNPAIKYKSDQDALWLALHNNQLDIIATDHAPHTLDEKLQGYSNAPSGLPLVQSSLQIMIEHVKNGKLTLEKMVEKMSHAPAECFKVKERGYLREGYFADLVIVDPNANYTVSKENILYKCGWSPFEGRTFSSVISSTFVNGRRVFDGTRIADEEKGMRLAFDR